MSKTEEKDYALNGYCLWLVPDEKTEPTLRKLIKDLAAEEPGAPEFHPHITLLSPKNALKFAAAELKEALQRAIEFLPDHGPLELTLNVPTEGTFYYQSVLSQVLKSDRLLDLRTAVEEACDDHPKVYFPHLSLLYGDLEGERKAQLCAEAAKRVDFPLKITVKEAVVVNVRGTAPDWEIVAGVPL